MARIYFGKFVLQFLFLSSQIFDFSWIATINGPKDTVFDQLSFKMNIHFSSQYPFSAPKVKFLNHCFHPNISPLGDICLDILKVEPF